MGWNKFWNVNYNSIVNAKWWNCALQSAHGSSLSPSCICCMLHPPKGQRKRHNVPQHLVLHTNRIVKLYLPSQTIDAKQCKQLKAFGELRHRHTKYWCKHLALNQHQCSTIQNEYHLQLIWPTTDQNDVHPAKRPYLYTSLDKRNHRLASKTLTTKESYIQNHVLPKLQINRFWGPDLKLWRSIVQQLHHHEKWEHHAHQDGAPVLENHTFSNDGPAVPSLL